MTLPYETLAAKPRATRPAALADEPRPRAARGVRGASTWRGRSSPRRKRARRTHAISASRTTPRSERLYNASEGHRPHRGRCTRSCPARSSSRKRRSKLCTVSIAHTDCTYDGSQRRFDAGASHLTHLYNAMPGIHHRKPGPIGARIRARKRALRSSSATATTSTPAPCGWRSGSSPAASASFPTRCAAAACRTDSIRSAARTCSCKGGVAKLADGTIAGSAANLYECMQRAVSFGIPAEQAILSATIIPAREIGQDAEIGSIAVGKLADFVVCDAALNRSAVYLGGQAL